MSSRELVIHDRQRTRAVNSPALRRIIRRLLERELQVPGYALGLNLVDANEMARLNEQFLRHHGSTDVITFDYGNPAAMGVEAPASDPAQGIHGEIFISLPDAVAQAKAFKTTWQSELVRYVIHGLLHLLGHDDLKREARALMKREENRLLKRLSREFNLRDLARREFARRNPHSAID